jgi:hypothetical protein
VPGVVRYPSTNVSYTLSTFVDSADPIYGTGMDGDITLDGTTTVLSMVPSSSVYTMTRDIYFNNLTINANVQLKPNGYRIFVKGTLTLNSNSTIGFTTGSSAAGSIKGGGAATTSVTHSLGGNAAATYTATAPTEGLGGTNWFKVPRQAVLGYSITASGGPTFLNGGAGGTNPGGAIVILAARYISPPTSGTAYIKAAGQSGANNSGGGVILLVSSGPSLPSSVSTDVTAGGAGAGAGTYNYMQLV